MGRVQIDYKTCNPNLLVPAYLCHSYLYYGLDESVISDGEYDSICVRLLKEYDNITHIHKEFVHKENLEAGTGMHVWMNPNLPRCIEGASFFLLRNRDKYNKGE